MLEPRHALPRRLPRICLRYLTFFGINIGSSWPPGSDLGQSQPVLRTRDALQLAFIDPDLHTDLSVGGPRLSEPVIDVGAQGVQRQLTLQVPLGAGDLRASEAPRHADLHALGAEAHRR